MTDYLNPHRIYPDNPSRRIDGLPEEAILFKNLEYDNAIIGENTEGCTNWFTTVYKQKKNRANVK